MNPTETSFEQKDVSGPYTFTSELCKRSHFNLPLYSYWCSKIKEKPLMRRKQWEFIFIIHSLFERNFLESEMKGLGFGVGQEPLPSLFASMGCNIVATDAPMDIDAGWKNTGEHIGSEVGKLNERNICDEIKFRNKVNFRYVDMNNISPDLNNFDFCWSACAFEHLGSIQKGLEFVENSLKTLRPGGVAIHTTEFNLTSNDKTLEHPNLVLFRKQDILRLKEMLESKGHFVETISFDSGESTIDYFVDIPPYYRKKVHLKLELDNYVTTSVGLIIRKKV